MIVEHLTGRQAMETLLMKGSGQEIRLIFVKPEQLIVKHCGNHMLIL